MPKTYAQKAEVIDQMADRLENASIVYLTNYSGLSVGQSNKLRGKLRAAEIDYAVCKNTLLSLALDRVGGLDDLKPFLTGPTAIAISDDPAVPARVFKDFLDDEDTERPELKVAYIDGDLYEGPEALDALAKLKSRDELIGDVLGLVLAPARNIAGALQGAGSQIAGAIQAIADEKEEA
jgi:large subunit ribosomal protein L10